MQNTTTATAPKFLNAHGYSDVHPYEVVRVVSETTVEVREMDATLDPAWKADAVPGGFFCHVRNNDSQRWIITSNPHNPVVRVRLTKRGTWKAARSSDVFLPAAEPRRFNDYNF